MNEQFSNDSLYANVSTVVTSRNDDYVAELDLTRAIPLTIILVLLDFIAMFGNSVVIIAVVRERSLRITTNYFVVSLAVADLFLSVLVLPFSILKEVVGYWLLDENMCIFWAAIDVLICTASILNLVAISFDRYLAISKPMQYPKFSTDRNTAIVIFVVWFLATAISLPPLFGWRQTDTNLHQCELTSGQGYVTYSALGSFYIPAALLLFLYSRIYLVAAKATRDIKRGRLLGEIRTLPYVRETGENGQTTAIYSSTACRQSCISTNSQDPFLSDSRTKNKDTLAKRLRKFAKDKKAAKTLAIVVGCFILCWAPFFVVYLVTGVCTQCVVPEVVFKIFFWLGYCNSCFNPIIYPCLNRDFRRAYKKIFTNAHCKRSRRSEKNFPITSASRAFRLSIPESVSSLSPPDSPTIAVTRRQSQFREIRKASIALASTVLVTADRSVSGLHNHNQISRIAIPNICEYCHRRCVMGYKNDFNSLTPSKVRFESTHKSIATQTENYELIRPLKTSKTKDLISFEKTFRNPSFCSEPNVSRAVLQVRRASSTNNCESCASQSPTGKCFQEGDELDDSVTSLSIKISDEIFATTEITASGAAADSGDDDAVTAVRDRRSNYKNSCSRKQLARTSSLQTRRSSYASVERYRRIKSLTTLCRDDTTCFPLHRSASVRPTRHVMKRVGYEQIQDTYSDSLNYSIVRV